MIQAGCYTHLLNRDCQPGVTIPIASFDGEDDQAISVGNYDIDGNVRYSGIAACQDPWVVLRRNYIRPWLKPLLSANCAIQAKSRLSPNAWTDTATDSS
ncbi:unnamed protein product [Aspergillus oryzae]|nr:unnamed protein product [Aspergillus oryzae]GMF86954.1 unnamed protein product [Aspergillus oryzae]